MTIYMNQQSFAGSYKACSYPSAGRNFTSQSDVKISIKKKVTTQKNEASNKKS